MTSQTANARAQYAARRLPAAPLVAWLREHLPGAAPTAVATEAGGFGERTLRRIYSGDQARTSIAWADTLLTALGHRLDDVWEPEDRVDACALCGAPVVRWRSAGDVVLVLDEDQLTDHGITCPHGAIPALVTA